MTAVAFAGVLVDEDDYNPRPVPYSMVRMSGQRGGCLSFDHRQGAEYLLLLTRGAGL